MKRNITVVLFLLILSIFSISFVGNIASTSATGNLMSWWKFDQSSGDALDSSGNRVTLTNNSATYTTGKTNNAASFNGSVDFTTPTGPDLANKSFSISGWLYANNLSADKVWLNLGIDSEDDKALHLRLTNTGALRFGFFFDDLDTEDNVFSINTWHQVTYTYDTTTKARSIYLDGILKANDTAQGNFSGTTDLSLGSWQGSEPWVGKIDEVKIYNRVLNSSEIAELAAGAGGPDTATTTIVSHLTWQETQPAGNTDIYWSKAKMSRDGRIVLVGAQNGQRLYLSKDSGSTWTQPQPSGDTDDSWFSLGVSSNGQTLLAGAYGGRMYLSTDEGDTWTDIQSAGDTDSNWITGALSADGRTIFTGVSNGRLYLSHDAGVTWAETQPAGDIDSGWITTAADETGTTLLAGAYGGRLYRSTNGGTTWSELQPGGNSNLNWNTTSISKNGQIMLAGIDEAGYEAKGKMYVSYNAGNTWLQISQGNLSGEEWRVAAMSDDGKVMLIGDGDGMYGRLYLSLDSGFTWTETQPAGDADFLWTAGAISGDGYNLIVGAGSNSGTRRVYVARLTRPPVETPAPQKLTCGSAAPDGKPNLFQIDASKNQAKLYFTPTTKTDKYMISFGYTPGDLRFGAETVAGSSSGVISYTINYLTPQTSYYVRVRAGNGCTTGEWGNEMKFTTQKKGSTSLKKFYK